MTENSGTPVNLIITDSMTDNMSSAVESWSAPYLPSMNFLSQFICLHQSLMSSFFALRHHKLDYLYDRNDCQRQAHTYEKICQR